jgi:hypothetical protein
LATIKIARGCALPRDSRRWEIRSDARHPVEWIADMAYDEELARRIRQLIGSDPELTEKMWKNRC